MELEKYLLPNILDNHLAKYKKEIIQYFNVYRSEFMYGQKRDNCGVVSSGFVFFMKKYNIELTRVHGEFITDIGSFKKLDFYKEELIQMENLGLNPNKLSDRMKFVEQFNLFERQKKIPHYWNMDSDGLIIDLSGYSQFIKTGMAKDLNIQRYEYTNPNILNKMKI